MDEDFLILLPSEDGDGYTMKAYITCFPSGFNPASKLDKKLRDIHGPVPAYKEKLEKSMDRFFDKLEVGKVVKRSNVKRPTPFSECMLKLYQWSITTHDRLYAASGNHLYEGEEPEDEEVNLNNVSLNFTPHLFQSTEQK